MSDQKNLVLTNYNVNEINGLLSEEEKIKHIVSYLEDVHALLNKQQETIHSLQELLSISNDRLDSHSEHLKAHDEHLAAHGRHLSSHDQHLDTLTNK